MPAASSTVRKGRAHALDCFINFKQTVNTPHEIRPGSMVTVGYQQKRDSPARVSRVWSGYLNRWVFKRPATVLPKHVRRWSAGRDASMAAAAFFSSSTLRACECKVVQLPSCRQCKTYKSTHAQTMGYATDVGLTCSFLCWLLRSAM